MKSLAIILVMFSFSLGLKSQEVSGYVEAEGRYFFEEGTNPGQVQFYPSLAVELDYHSDFKGSNKEFNAVVFGRYDFLDQTRTHIDFREFYYQHNLGSAYTSIGIKKVFWGVVESLNVNDIINQKDFLEGINGDAKLGELMWQNVFIRPFGTFETYFMPYHRPARFPGESGRLRPPIDTTDLDHDLYTNSLRHLYPSVVLRYKHSIGNMDLGINYSHLVSREPVIEYGSGHPVVYYPIINQIGGDIQYTLPGLLLKLEFNNRIYHGSKLAFVTGFEYTFGNVFNTGGDLGIILEYLFDERGINTIRSMDNDLFIGFRYSGNNIAGTQIVAGSIIDLSKSSRIYSIEVSHRLGSLIKLQLESKWFHNISNQEFIHLFENDSYIQLKLFLYLF